MRAMAPRTALRGLDLGIGEEAEHDRRRLLIQPSGMLMQRFRTLFRPSGVLLDDATIPKKYHLSSAVNELICVRLPIGHKSLKIQ